MRLDVGALTAAEEKRLEFMFPAVMMFLYVVITGLCIMAMVFIFVKCVVMPSQDDGRIHGNWKRGDLLSYDYVPASITSSVTSHHAQLLQSRDSRSQERSMEILRSYFKNSTQIPVAKIWREIMSNLSLCCKYCHCFKLTVNHWINSIRNNFFCNRRWFLMFYFFNFW